MVAEPAGELPEIRKRRNEIEIGANLCLSYRFAPILYRYGLSTVYQNTNLIEQRDQYKELYNDLEEDYKSLKDECNSLKSEIDSSSSSSSSNDSRSSNDNDENSSESTSSMVWISETGEKYHNKPNCGRMNPDNAYQMSRSAAESAGYDACSKCF